MLCTAVVNETRFICSNDGVPFLLTFYKASQLFFEAGVVAQRCFDSSLLLPQKKPQKTLPCCVSHTTKCFKGQCLPAKAEGLVWFLSSFSPLLAMSFPRVCFPISSPVCFLASPFLFLSPQPFLTFSLRDCWKEKLPVMARITEITLSTGGDCSEQYCVYRMQLCQMA